MAPLRLSFGRDSFNELTTLGERFGLAPDELANLLLEPAAPEKLLNIQAALDLALKDRRDILKQDAEAVTDAQVEREKQPRQPGAELLTD